MNQTGKYKIIRRGYIYEQDREMRNIRSRYLWTRQGIEKYKK